jgi:outer membrane lipoprotein-sorting protein
VATIFYQDDQKEKRTMFRKMALSLAALAILGLSAQAQTVDDVIAKNIQARGGIDKLKSIQTLRMSGKVDLGSIILPVTITSARPGKIRIEFTVQGLTGVQAYDGKGGWQLMPFQGKKDPEALGGDELKQFSHDADFDGPLVNYKDKGYKAELIGKEQIEGTDAYKIKVTLKDGDIRYIFLDADSYLEIEEREKVTVRGSQQDVKTVMGDYKEVEGLMFAFSLHTVVEGDTGPMPGDRKITVEKFEINPKLEEGIFEMPAAKPEDKKP